MEDDYIDKERASATIRLEEFREALKLKRIENQLDSERLDSPEEIIEQEENTKLFMPGQLEILRRDSLEESEYLLLINYF
jgi:hypothetical protein